MEVKLFDSELNVMEVLWKEGELAAGQIAKILNEQIGWNRNTTYTVIKKLIDKGAIERIEPNFICRASISKEQIQQFETRELIGKLFNGSSEMFISAFFNSGDLSDGEIERLRQIVEKLK